MLSYTPNFEDVLLQRCFRDVKCGFYVDVGAHHPTNASVTRWFYDRGWSGINIEPGEGIEALKAERTRDINLAVAVADFEGEKIFWVHSGNTGTSTLSRSIPQVVAEKAGQIRPQKVCVTKLQSILDRHAAGRHIHFLKIDAEGAEDAIVRSTNWKRYRPEVIVIESTEPYTNTRREENWQKILQNNDYTLGYFDGVNDFWIRQESAHLTQAFNVPVNVLDFFRSYDPELVTLRNMVSTLTTDLAIANSRIAELTAAVAMSQRSNTSVARSIAAQDRSLAKAASRLSGKILERIHHLFAG